MDPSTLTPQPATAFLNGVSPLVVTLDGWILDSGQHPPIAPHDTVELAIEVGAIARSNSTEVAAAPLPVWQPDTGTYRVMARVAEVTKRVTIFDVGTLVYAASSTVEQELVTDRRRAISSGDEIALAIALSVDPYLGRRRPSWFPENLIRPWIVTDVGRRDAGDTNYRSVTTTTPHSANTLYRLGIAALSQPRAPIQEPVVRPHPGTSPSKK